MKARSVAARAVFAALLLAAPALATDVPDPAAQQQYDLFDSTSPTVTDLYTHLEWDRNQVKALDFGSAVVKCGSVFGAGPGGRVPSIKELLTVFDELPHQEDVQAELHDVFIYRNAFPNTPIDHPYWSSTPANGSATQMWTLDFSTGTMTAMDMSATANVRCVR